MAKYAELPDGTHLEFPDETKDSVMDMVVAQHMGDMVKPQIEGGGAARSLGIGTRNVLEGVGGMVGSVVNPVANLADMATGGTGTRFQNPGKALADYFGLSTARTQGERIAGTAIEGVSGALPTLGAGVVMQAAKYAPSVARASFSELPRLVGGAKNPANIAPATIDALRSMGLLGNATIRGEVGVALANMPRLQMLSGLTGGGAMGVAQESGVGPLGQIVAGIGGSILPGTAGVGGSILSRGLRSTAGALDRLTPFGQARLAGTAIENFSADPSHVRKIAEQGGGVLISGSQPTTAQLTGDPKLAIMEKALQSTPEGGAIRERYTAQQEAQREFLNNLLNPVRERQQSAIAAVPEQLREAAPFGANLDERTGGGMLRNSFDKEYGVMKDAVRQFYDSIDPEGTARFDLRPLVEQFQQSLGGGRYQRVPGEIQSFLSQMQDDIANGVNVTYRDLQNVRTALTDMAQSAAAKGDAPVQRIAGMMKQNLDGYLEQQSASPELMGGAPSPRVGTGAYRDATRQASGTVSQDPWYDDLQTLMQNGLNKEAVERIVGPAGIEELNKLAPGIIRQSGRLMPDTVAADLGSFESLIQSTGGGSYHADADSFLQALSQRLNGMYGRKKQSVSNIRQDYMEQAAQPHTGFTPEQSAAFQNAKTLRREMGERFEQGANQALTRRGNSIEGQGIADSAIPSNYFSPKGKGSENMEAFQRSIGQQLAAQSVMADNVISTALQQSTNARGILDPTKLQKFMELYRPALSQLDNADVEKALQRAIETQNDNMTAQSGLASVAHPDAAGNWQLRKALRQFPEIPQNAGLNPDEMMGINVSQQDLKRVLDTQNKAAVNGSPTAQLQTVLNELGRFKMGTMGGGGMAKNLLNEIISGVTAGSDDKIERMLVQSVLDPEYAAKLMANTNNMRGNGLIDSARRWSGRKRDSFSEMLKQYGIATSISAGRTPAQAKGDR